ncbi:hypothetical protein [Vibrio parahaemolyticus]|uniref:hypothetical protein n=1 Tax=Vibrio parahaemolyticus TaxID=670 RepID=UPI001D165BAB|nr:hypothetical protein [Vibrio parahaemolyticus]MCC3787401.1 hypothetical protein [Vibrio parahaemolyticus]MCC3834853.1 hypothetical protein [Vibrio parahaemolyticus]MCC3839423.1 hypothetical protein [Vibrio parahaemolyticus]
MKAVTWGFVGTIVGALASIATTAIASWSSHVLSNKAKEHEKQEIANAFQRETVLELQTELLEYFRSCNQIYRNDKVNFENTGKWGYSIPDELDEKNRVLNAKTAILIQRISNGELRVSLRALKDNFAKCLMADNELEAASYHRKAVEGYDTASDLLGKVLRSTYWQPNA